MALIRTGGGVSVNALKGKTVKMNGDTIVIENVSASTTVTMASQGKEGVIIADVSNYSTATVTNTGVPFDYGHAYGIAPNGTATMIGQFSQVSDVSGYEYLILSGCANGGFDITLALS